MPRDLVKLTNERPPESAWWLAAMSLFKGAPAPAILYSPADRVTALDASAYEGGKSELHRARVLGNAQEG